MIERIGNRLPEPTLLFVILALLVVALSAVGSVAGWQVQPLRVETVTAPVLGATGAPVLGADGQAVEAPVLGADGRPEVRLVASGEPVRPRSLLTADGVYWMLSSMLRNFVTLPAVPLVFVAMLGIGLAEKFGFFSALMRALALRTPSRLLTPVVVLLGANASIASDAGYVILPPLAAALFAAAGRHPVAGLAAAFAGVAGGFGAGFFPTGGDAVLAGFAQDAARVVAPDYSVTILHNLYFKAASVLVVTLAGWFVTDRIVEPRLLRTTAPPVPMAPDSPDAAAPEGDVVAAMSLTRTEQRGLRAALAAQAAVVALFAALIFVPGLPLHGPGQPTLPDGRVLVHHPVVVALPSATGAPESSLGADVAAHDVLARAPLVVAETHTSRARLVEPPGPRWSQVIVPLIFLAFLVPGLVYGRVTGALRTQADVIEGFYHGIRSIVPVLAIAFFMAQFVAYFAYSGLDRMLAYAGGAHLAEASLPVPVLVALFVVVVVFGDFAISGMLSKFGVLAPVFVPMFMMAGVSPELTTAAYRIGDSVVNIVTPLNSYLLLILVVLQKYRRGAGLGNLIALMLPYSVVFGVAWTLLLLAWIALGLPLGPSAPLLYPPAP